MSKFYIPRRSLAVYKPFKLVIPPQALSGFIIDDRYQIGEFLGDGYTGSVRSGKNVKSIFNLLYLKITQNETTQPGVDLVTGQPVAIKFSTKDLFDSLEMEFVNYLYLGADGLYL